MHRCFFVLIQKQTIIYDSHHQNISHFSYTHLLFIVDKTIMNRFYFIFLILQIGIQAEPLSLSFINIIPRIIANGRFVKENIDKTDFILQPIVPSINTDLLLSTNGSNCTQDIKLLVESLKSKKLWALKSMLDVSFLYSFLNVCF